MVVKQMVQQDQVQVGSEGLTPPVNPAQGNNGGGGQQQMIGGGGGGGASRYWI